MPFLGTCGGFQHTLLEYARNVWHVSDAAHAELDPNAPNPIIAPLSCELVERTGRVRAVPGSRLAAICGESEFRETYHCRYGLSPQWAGRLDRGPLSVSARDEAGEVRAIELTGHPFFMATLFQPERAGLAGRSHPLVEALLHAAEGGA